MSNKIDQTWEYSINHDFNEVLQWMEANNKSSILDLGAGIGDVLLQAKSAGLKVKGYENDSSLLSEKVVDEIEEKDILKLYKKDLEGYEVIYCWEPFKNPVFTKGFLERTFSKLHKGQVLIYRAQKHMPGSLPFERYGKHFIVVK